LRVSEEFDPHSGIIVDKAILAIPAGRCAWATKPHGGCTMCGFNGPFSAKTKFTLNGKPWPHWLCALYVKRELRSVRNVPTVLCVFNGGSFLNPDEVPIRTQEYVADLAARHPHVVRLFIESRCEFVSKDRLLRLRNILGKTALEVGVGLESATDAVRNGLLNKGLTIDCYAAAIRAIRESGALALTYIFLKPPALSEQKAIEDAAESIRVAFEAGSHTVSLSCAMVQAGTPLYEKWRQREYRAPWLWSVVETIRQTAAFGPVRVGTFDDEPQPLEVPHNCGACDARVIKALECYRQTLDVAELLHETARCECACRKSWPALTRGEMGDV